MKLNFPNHFLERTKLTLREFQMLSLSVFLSVVMYPLVVFGFKCPDLGIVAWVHLVPLLLVLEKSDFKRQAFLIFFVLSLSLFGHLYWLEVAMRSFGGLNFVFSFLILGLLVLFLAFVKTLFFMGAMWVKKHGKISLALSLPIFLTLHDYTLHHFPFGGFPWVLPAYSQGQWMMFFQWVSVTGAFGLGFFIYLMNALLAEGIFYFSLSKGIDKSIARFFLVFVLGLTSLYFSFLASQHFEKKQINKGEITLALLQPNISQDLKWSRESLRHHLRLLKDMTFSAIQDGAELVLWPESAYPYRLSQQELNDERFLDYSEWPADLFLGAIVATQQDGSNSLYNSVLHVNPEARIVGQYNKMHLVPFGEYVPYADWLTFVDKFTEAVGDFEAGKKPILFHVKDIAFGSLICYEDVFLDVARQFSLTGADVLVNYTNDAWYKNTSAQYQHVVMSQFRALENRKPLVRATNTGKTVVINARGFIIDELMPFQTRFLLHRLKVVSQLSLFSRFGYGWMVFLKIMMVFMLLYTYGVLRLSSHRVPRQKEK